MSGAKVIAPTIGRKVWFWPSGLTHILGARLVNLSPEQPMDATVVYVHGERLVNLLVLDHSGVPFAVPNVPLRQPSDDTAPEAAHCVWMPYQVGQAKAAEPRPRQYEWAHVAQHRISHNELEDTVDFKVRMRDGAEYHGLARLHPGQAWQRAVIDLINAEKATLIAPPKA